MREPVFLPTRLWPVQDRVAFETALSAGDLFDEPVKRGTNWAMATRRMMESAYGRWLGFIRDTEPSILDLDPVQRIIKRRVGSFIIELRATMRTTSVCLITSNLHTAARILDPNHDWAWLGVLSRRLSGSAVSLDRLDRLVAPWQSLDAGIRLMDEALKLKTSSRKVREIQFRDGLLIALLSLWPIRRRSLASLTISHVVRTSDHIALVLRDEDTKSQKGSSFQVPQLLQYYILIYLDGIRPNLLNGRDSDALWVGFKARPLLSAGLYWCIRRRMLTETGRDMALHDFRRAAATFIAIEAPEKIGLIPPVLQHGGPEIADKHYNLARSGDASRLYSGLIGRLRSNLRKRNDDGDPCVP